MRCLYRNIVLLLLILFLDSRSQYTYEFKRFNEQDGLGDTEVGEIFQDTKGYIWTNCKGVTYYNGYKFLSIQPHLLKRVTRINQFIEVNGITYAVMFNTDVIDLTNRQLINLPGILDKSKQGVIASCVIDKEGYFIFPYNKLEDRNKMFLSDTVYFLAKGQLSYTLFPKETIKNKRRTFVNEYKQVVVMSINESNQQYSAYLFDKGHLRLLFMANDFNDNHEHQVFLDSLGYIYHLTTKEIYKYDRSGKMVLKHEFNSIQNYISEYVFDSDYNLWLPCKEGLIKIDTKNKIKTFNDEKRNVQQEIIQRQYGNVWRPELIENNYNYKFIAINKNNLIINGDRCFYQNKFYNLCDDPEFNKIVRNIYGSQNLDNQQQFTIRKIIFDNEENVWISSDIGLFRFTRIPFKPEKENVIYKNNEFEYNISDNLGRDYYIHSDNINRNLTILIKNKDSITFTKNYKISGFLSGIEDYQRAVKYKNGILFTYNGSDNRYNMIYWNGNEKNIYKFSSMPNDINIKSNYQYYYTYSKTDNGATNGELYQLNNDKMVVTKVNDKTIELLNNLYHKTRQKSKQFINNFLSETITTDNLKCYQLNLNHNFDTIYYCKDKNFYNYKKKKSEVINFNKFPVLSISEDAKFYVVNRHNFKELECVGCDTIKNYINDITKGQIISFNKSIILSTSGNSSIFLFEIDTINFKLKFIRNDSYLLNKDIKTGNIFFTYNNYVILKPNEINYLLVQPKSTYNKKGFDGAFKVKTGGIYFNQYENINEEVIDKLILDSSYFNKIAPKINLYKIIYSYGTKSDSVLWPNKSQKFNSDVILIDFKYDIISLSDADEIYGKYRVLGLDTTWQTFKLENNNSIKLQSIPPGSYTLQIQACNNHRYWGRLFEYSFRISFPWYRTWIAYTAYLLILICLFYFSIKIRTRKLEKDKASLENIVNERTSEISFQKHIIEEKQKEILDSINYAKRIQYTLLAHAEFLKENIPEHFTYFNPKDIVSGDFYWATKNNNKFYLAVCDSTGHGVPGAFMSLLNIGFLSEAINEKGIEKPNEVFDYVRLKLTNTISKEGQKDGFDGILICIDQNNKSITYAAANNAPIIIQNNQLVELQADRMPVGVGERKENFALHTIEANKGDTLYLYTDGYADQFGGPKGKKFKYKQLNELLISIHTKPLTEQHSELKSAFEKWRGDLEQVDDVCVIGIRL